MLDKNVHNIKEVQKELLSKKQTIVVDDFSNKKTKIEMEIEKIK